MKVVEVKTEFEVIKATKIAFCYTVKSLGVDKDADYDPFFDKLERFNIPIEYKISERDSKGKTHYHGIIYLDKGFYRKRLKTTGFNLKLEEMQNRSAWLKYIHKDVLPEHWPDSDEDFIDDYTPSARPTRRLF